MVNQEVLIAMCEVKIHMEYLHELRTTQQNKDVAL